MEKRKQTTLVKFLRAWLAWAESDKPEGPFYNGWGLCGNAEQYAMRKGVSAIKLNQALWDALDSDGLNPTYPFGYSRYWGYKHDRGTYGRASRANLDGQTKQNNRRDPVRLAWVRYYLARFDAGLI